MTLKLFIHMKNKYFLAIKNNSHAQKVKLLLSLFVLRFVVKIKNLFAAESRYHIKIIDQSQFVVIYI